MITTNAFGRTGHQSTRILFGAAALAGVSQEEADRTLDVLLRYGINHIDVAASYGEAELRVGPWMKKHRKDFFLASKTGERTYEKARQEIRRSLERLQTDALDLIQLHAMTEMGELETALGSGGALSAAVEARDEGLVRFIGITSHSLTAPSILMRALEAFDFASVLLPCDYPMMQNTAYAEGFNQLAAICEQRGVALQTIKAICRRPWAENAEHFAATWYEPLTDPAAIEKAVAYVLGRPQIFLNSVGDVALLPLVLEAASRFSRPPSDVEMQALVAAQEMAPLWQEHEPVH
jgi:aryl-alcohol dehydrogenase-like predicted oxidoreductase